MLITDDGDLAHRLAHPSFGSRKVYRVEVHPQLEYKQAMRLVRGIELADGLARAIEVTQVTASVYDRLSGNRRKRQLRRMITALGSHVISINYALNKPASSSAVCVPAAGANLLPQNFACCVPSSPQPTTSKHTEADHISLVDEENLIIHSMASPKSVPDQKDSRRQTP